MKVIVQILLMKVIISMATNHRNIVDVHNRLLHRQSCFNFNYVQLVVKLVYEYFVYSQHTIAFVGPPHSLNVYFIMYVCS